MGSDPGKIDRLRRKVRLLEEMFEQSSRQAFIDGQRRQLITSLLRLSLHAKNVDQLLQDTLSSLLSCNFLQIENWGAIFLASGDGSLLTLRAHHNFTAGQRRQCSRIRPGQCLCGQAFADREIIFTTSDDPRHTTRFPDMPPHGHYCIPIRAGSRMLGLICLHVPDSLRQEKEDWDMLTTAAGILAGALQRLAYAEELSSYQSHLEQMVEEKIEELRQAENKYRAIFENSLNGIFQTTPAGCFLACNPALARMHGYADPEEMISSVTDIARQLYVNPGDRSRLLELLRQGPVTDYETRMYRKDGSVFRVRMSARMITTAAGGQYMEGTLLDITKRKEAEEKLAEQKERLDVTLRSIGDGVITTDTGGRVVLLNRAAEELTGWSQEEAIGRLLAEVFHTVSEDSGRPCPDPVQRVMEGGRRVCKEHQVLLMARGAGRRHISHSGTPILDSQGNTVGVVLVFSDITRQVLLEAEVIKSKKLESLAVLAGGIAHDFNNILTAILGNLSLIEVSLARERSEISDMARQARKAAVRARDLVRQLQTFAKGGEPIRGAAAIDEIIRESAGFVLRGSQVGVRYHFPPDLWFADIDAGQISQVIQNLVINAKQAMPSGGRLEIACANVTKQGHDPLPLADGLYIRVTVRDQGSGMDDHTLSRIFDPYFTTKATGHGLGLAICHSIIRRHGGYITVTSEPGKGTEFVFYVRATRERPQQSVSSGPARTAARDRVLVMDDDPLVARSTCRMLEHLGFRVTLTGDGREAIKKYAQAMEEGTPYALAIVDLTVPGGMGGEETARELQRLDPEARVVVTSGYSDNPVLASHREHGFAAVLVKPFQVEEVGVILERLMTR